MPLENYLNACEGATALAGFDYKGRVWGTDSAAQGGGYAHIMTPNLKACVFRGQPLPLEYSAVCVGTSSFHPGGVNVGFLDGSVRFVKDDVNRQTWWALATRAGGEVIDAGAYRDPRQRHPGRPSARPPLTQAGGRRGVDPRRHRFPFPRSSGIA